MFRCDGKLPPQPLQTANDGTAGARWQVESWAGKQSWHQLLKSGLEKIEQTSSRGSAVLFRVPDPRTGDGAQFFSDCHAARRSSAQRPPPKPQTLAADLAPELADSVAGFAFDPDLGKLALEQAGAAPAMNRPATAVVHHLEHIGQLAADVADSQRLGLSSQTPHAFRLTDRHRSSRAFAPVRSQIGYVTLAHARTHVFHRRDKCRMNSRWTKSINWPHNFSSSGWGPG